MVGLLSEITGPYWNFSTASRLWFKASSELFTLPLWGVIMTFIGRVFEFTRHHILISLFTIYPPGGISPSHRTSTAYNATFTRPTHLEKWHPIAQVISNPYAMTCRRSNTIVVGPYLTNSSPVILQAWACVFGQLFGEFHMRLVITIIICLLVFVRNSLHGSNVSHLILVFSL